MTDVNDIRVLIDYGTGFKHVGFRAEELTKYAHHVTRRGKLAWYATNIPGSALREITTRSKHPIPD